MAARHAWPPRADELKRLASSIERAVAQRSQFRRASAMLASAIATGADEEDPGAAEEEIIPRLESVLRWLRKPRLV